LRIGGALAVADRRRPRYIPSDFSDYVATAANTALLEVSSTMLLGVVSDTHGHIEYTREAVRMLDSLEVAEVIHCGDIGSPEVIPLFSAWPAHFVFGNVDYDEPSLRTAIDESGQTCHGRFGSLVREGIRIAFLHSDDARLFAQTVQSGGADLVCYGHTHIAKQHRQGRTLVLNPGALYRATPHSIAVVELPSLKATIVTL
jgi:putative phosphoesterase